LTLFDAHTDSYDADLTRGLEVSGEGKEYFAEGRVRWFAKRLAERAAPAKRVLDFGCGTGDTAPLFRSILGAEEIIGVDESERSLAVARASYGAHARFHSAAELGPGADVDVAYCNGLFHHVPPPERAGVMATIAGALRRGGYFALWENNPWNPGARYVMWRIPFDRDAIMLAASEARSLGVGAGLEIVATDYLFFFPRALRPLRFLEPKLVRWPVGAQYQVLLRKT
jgi:SAM-dependent methyltransferase